MKTTSARIRAKDLLTIGFPDSPVVSIAMNIIQKTYKYHSKEEAMQLLEKILKSPVEYANDAVLGLIAQKLIAFTETANEDNATDHKTGAQISVNQAGIPFNVFGKEYIEEGAMHQMYQAAKLPVSVAGALMPDAHSGYGLPIGGVLATENAVIPYGVGVDIGCRMCLSIFDIHPKELVQKENYFIRELNDATLFGSGRQFDHSENHEVMDNSTFSQIPMLKNMHGRAWKQLGTSGSGNHFAEFGAVEITEKDPHLGLSAGLYLGLLSHSGSRSLGANIANFYTKIARSKRRLPGESANLAWLTLDEEAGIEYWMAMNLAGDYAAACHHVIHGKIARQLGRKPMKMVENHHNFAWKEMLHTEQGYREVVVHRKGATPAGKNVLGIIPGSMTADGFIVKGKGEEAAVNSAAHGAGRRMSRTRANASITEKQLKDELTKYGVTLLGGGLDESPFAYKDIETVMKSQKQLVEVIGRFTPKIVKMDGPRNKSFKGLMV